MIDRLVIISNESISKNDNGFYCDNIDSKSIPEGLNKNFDVLLIGKKSKTKRSNKINLKNVSLASNIFFFILNVFKTFKNKETKYLLISINPYSFFAYLVLLVFRKKTYVYLRSNGYEEWKYILGYVGYFLFHIMFSIVSWKAILISCQPHILNGKPGQIVSPSQLNEKWFSSYKNPDLNKIKLLYVGRIKVEKGIFSFLKILKDFKLNFKLSIIGVGTNTNHKINQNNINIFDFNNENDSIIKVYDDHNIFVLPSFTEGHPQVLDEALARQRPVIIFEEISHVIGNKKGIFVSKRDSISLSNTINHIISNYQSIQEKIMQNILPTKASFLKQMTNIIKGN